MTAVLMSMALDVAVRMTLLAAAIALILALFRIRSSSTRHAAWTVVLGVMLLMPVLVRLVPSVTVPVPARLWMALPVAGKPLSRAVSVATARPGPPAAAAGPAATTPVPVALLPETVGLSSIASPKSISWWTVLFSVYAAGVVFFAVRLFIGFVQLARIRRNSRLVTAAGVGAGAVVFESPSLATPVTIGLIRPRVVLPAGWREWPADMLSAVVAHERAHVARRDPLIATLARVNCALSWFHPLAWWLERELALTAEHACDDAAVQAVTRRQYAEALLDIAATVRRHRGRLVAPAVGVSGGQLDRRIDRVLSAASAPALSRPRAALVSMSCAVMIAAAIACRQELRAEPLREDPQVAADVKARTDLQREREAFQNAAERMTRDEAAALERILETNPEDTVVREKLLMFYGRNKAAEDWKVNAAARLPHALWLIQHHPDSELVMRARVSKREDPAGYAQARDLWLAAMAREDKNARVLSNAARFFEASEKPLAEELLLRGQALPPDPPQAGSISQPWSWRLGTLYAYAIIGRPDDDPDVRWARERLEQSNDARVLYAAGADLSWRPAQSEWKQFGRRLLERASQLDADVAKQVRTLLYQRDVLSAQGAFGGRPTTEWAAALKQSTGLERLRQLAALSEQQYLMAEYYNWLSKQPESVRPPAVNRNPVAPDQDRRTAAEMFGRSKVYAREAIDLAASLSGRGARESAFRAHLAYGLGALREGDRRAAVDQLLQASRFPPPPYPAVGGWAASALEYRLAYYLLKLGERQTIVEYLERAAQTREEKPRQEMLKAAAAIRAGRMPAHYQTLLASGSV